MGICILNYPQLSLPWGSHQPRCQTELPSSTTPAPEIRGYCGVDVVVARFYSHWDFTWSLPGLRRQAAVAIACPTLVFIELLPGSSAEGWPCCTGGGASGEQPSGRKCTCPGGGIWQLANSCTADVCGSGLDWLLLEVVVSEELSWWFSWCLSAIVSPLVVGFSGGNVLFGKSGRNWNIL